MNSTTATRPRIDPRIARRRQAVANDRIQHRRRVVAAVLVAAVLVLAVVGVTRSPILDVDRIQVRGSGSSAETAAVAAAAGVALGDPMVDLDAGAVRAAVESIAWVHTATIGRDWPGTVIVTVRPRVEVAAVERPAPADGDVTWALVDGEGVVTGVTSEAPAGLPRVTGSPVGQAPGASVDGSLLAALAAAEAMPAALDSGC